MAVYQVGERFRVFAGYCKQGWARRQWWAVYQCDCGERFLMQERSAKNTKSCGCHAKETSRKLLQNQQYRLTHGQTNSRTYKSWAGMIGRSQNPKHIEYERYGARGITVCKEWQEFAGFFADMGERPKGMSIDRIDVNQGYCKENCRWATPKEQARNTRRNVLITIDGETKTVAEWVELTGAAKDKTVYQRIKKGLTGREALYGRKA